MKSARIAAWEARLRPLLVRLPPALALRLYSEGRRRFLAAFARQPPARAFTPEGLERTLWGVRFRSPLINAAGMFKRGEGYAVAAGQGAGAYLAGTTTHRRRAGNRRGGVAQPFAPYPTSGAASNWLGLPNPGHRAVAERLAGLRRQAGCPVGASLAACPDPRVDGAEKLERLVAGLTLYEAAGVDFLEMNESCPNTEEDTRGLEELAGRLAYVGEHFLARRSRPVPVVVKLSCDTALEQVPALIATLLEHGFDGVNFGNTSTDYRRHRHCLAAPEVALYDRFTRLYGGGVSGRPLKDGSLSLAAAAVREARALEPPGEFHVLRTGGVEDAEDVRRSLDAGIALCQWYTAYFDAFSRHGHALYKDLYGGL